MVSEVEMRKQFVEGFRFPPLAIRLGRKDAFSGKDVGLDAVLAIDLDGQTIEFAAEFKSRNSPRIFEDALGYVEKAAGRQGMLPMLIVPYLRENQLEELQRRQLSGIDLSGNGVISIPGRLLVYRTGAANKFPDSAPTKYAYRGATSLVARAFMCRDKYRSLVDVEGEIRRRGGRVVLSTISKALKRMEDDLIIDRNDGELRLRQPDKLLQKLSEGYAAPKVSRSLTLKMKNAPRDSGGQQGIAGGLQLVPALTLDEPSLGKNRLVLTGASSIENYAVMGRQDWPVFYTSDVDGILEVWGDDVEPTSRFFDLELRQTDDPTVYFDARWKRNLPNASPIQVYLECLAGDKRERETAAQVKDLILRELGA